MPEFQPREGARAAISASVGDVVLLEIAKLLNVAFVAGDEDEVELPGGREGVVLVDPVPVLEP